MLQYIESKIRKPTVFVIIVSALVVTVSAQQKQSLSLTQSLDMGRGMSLLNADLLQIAIQSDFFLQFGEAIKLSAEQQKTLEEAYFEIQKYTVRRKADLDVADAELRRLLSNDRVDLAAVQAKVKEVESIQSEATIKKIEYALRAVSVLTHEQHLRVVLLVRQKLNQELQAQDG